VVSETSKGRRFCISWMRRYALGEFSVIRWGHSSQKEGEVEGGAGRAIGI